MNVQTNNQRQHNWRTESIEIRTRRTTNVFRRCVRARVRMRMCMFRQKSIGCD